MFPFSPAGVSFPHLWEIVNKSQVALWGYFPIKVDAACLHPAAWMEQSDYTTLVHTPSWLCDKQALDW